jgi:vacuolar-type H+-ATPase subunit E/Vma4
MSISELDQPLSPSEEKEIAIEVERRVQSILTRERRPIDQLMDEMLNIDQEEYQKHLRKIMTRQVRGEYRSARVD